MDFDLISFEMATSVMLRKHLKGVQIIIMFITAIESFPVQFFSKSRSRSLFQNNKINFFPNSVSRNRYGCKAHLSQRSIASFTSTDEGKDDNLKKIRILALHGKGGSGPEFQAKLTPLMKSLQKKYQDCNTLLDIDFITAPFDGGQWWTLPPGVRSFNADKYQGFETSVKLVQESVSKTKYDFILGHSQGAILLSAMMAQSTESNIWSEFGCQDNPVGLILNGAAWPNPYSELLESFQVSNDGNFQCLFIIGEIDAINPPEGAERVRDSMKTGGLEVSTIVHPRGHPVPVEDDKTVKSLFQWMQTVNQQ